MSTTERRDANAKSLEIDQTLEQTEFEDSYVVVSQVSDSLESGKAVVWTAIYESPDEKVASGKAIVDQELYNLNPGQVETEVFEKETVESEEGLEDYAENILEAEVPDTNAGALTLLHERYSERAEERDQLEPMSLEGYDQMLTETLENYNGIYSRQPELSE